MNQTAEKWINQPKQLRSRETQDTLMHAALDLFKENGFDAVTVNDIALKAGVSPATIYRRFSDKEGLLQAVHEYFTQQALDLMNKVEGSKTLDHLTLPELLSSVMVIVNNFVKGNQRILQASYSRALTDERFADRFVTVRKQVFAMLRKHFLKRRKEIGHPNPELALDFALRMTMGAFTYRIESVNLEVGLEPLTDKQFALELMRAFLSYLDVKYENLKVPDLSK